MIYMDGRQRAAEQGMLCPKLGTLVYFPEENS